MASQKLIAFREELQAQLAVIEPRLLGLLSFSRLDIHPDTSQAIVNQIEDYQRRIALIKQALLDMTALEEDGYPDLPVDLVQQIMLDDLRRKIEELLEAMKAFKLPQTTTLGIEVGIPVPKEP